MALSFIGKPISLISHSDVRYRGILAGIDPAASTIQLSNVFSMGTESRKPPSEFIPPVQEPYQYIIFRASEVKDLAVDEPSPRRSVHDDPAVLGASAPGVAHQTAYSPYGSPYTQPPVPGSQQPLQTPQPPPPQQSYPVSPPNVQGAPQEVQVPPPFQGPIVPSNTVDEASTSNGPRRVNNSVHTAAASLETVERALGDLRVSNGNGHRGGGRGGGRRGQGYGHGNGGPEIKAGEIKVPSTDFDFESSNARFDKAALAPKKTDESADDEQTNPSEGESPATKDKEAEQKAYNPQRSFFDSLSSSTQSVLAPRGGAGGGDRGGGRRGGNGRNRREEERERNVATFGEPGGVGLMGPGAYVGGWGGYGRRGVGRRGRGGPPATAISGR